MFRKLGIGAALVAALCVACGRQVTGLDAPNAGSIQPGHMLIRFRVAGPLDFSNVEYVIVFNTTGSKVEPYPQGLNSGFLNYSFAFVVGGNHSTSSPLLVQYYLAPGTSSGIGLFQITIPPQLINYVPNSGGNPGGGEFTINFSRSLLNIPTPGALPAPNVQPTPISSKWAINFITANPNSSPPGVPLDSMGIGGPADTTFSYTVDTSQAVDNVVPKPAGTGTVSNPSAQLQGFEVINAP